MQGAVAVLRVGRTRRTTAPTLPTVALATAAAPRVQQLQEPSHRGAAPCLRLAQRGSAVISRAMLGFEPCLPTLVKVPPSGELWIHEIKYEGFRTPGSSRHAANEGSIRM